MTPSLLATNIASYGVTVLAFIGGSVYLLVAKCRRVSYSLVNS